MVQVVPLRYDTAFKKAFSQLEVFCQFVHDVLGIDIHIDKVHRGYKYLKPVGQVDIEYDLFAEDEEARIVVEIQHIKEHDFFDRFLYSHLISLVEQVKSYRNYHLDKTVYTLVVLTGPSSEQSLPRSIGGGDFSVLIGNLSFVNEFKQRVDVYPHQLIFLVPRLVNEETPAGIKGWLELILDSLDDEIDETCYDSPVFQKVIDAIQLDNISPEELRKIKDEAVWDDALKEDFEKGREEGLREGLRQGKQQIAQSLLREGVDIDLIAKTTGLTREEIHQLKQTSAIHP